MAVRSVPVDVPPGAAVRARSAAWAAARRRRVVTDAAVSTIVEGTSNGDGPMLEMEDVHTYYGHIHALRGSRSPSAGARSSR